MPFTARRPFVVAYNLIRSWLSRWLPLLCMERGKSAVVRHGKCTSSPLIPLTKIASLHDRSDMHFSLNMSLLPSAFSTKHIPCLSAWTIKKNNVEGTATKKKGKSASVGCNTICCFLGGRGCLSGSCVRCLGFKYFSQTAKSVKTIGRDMKVWARTHTGVK